VVYDDQATPFYGRELEQVTQERRTLAARAGRIARRLPASAQDAWFELIGYEAAGVSPGDRQGHRTADHRALPEGDLIGGHGET
jgi:hypothetical protein